MESGPVRGRGASSNPPNRFEKIEIVRDDPDDPSPETEFLRDTSRSIIATNDSPDVGFEASVNPYRGCEHGCSYCLSGETLILMGDGTAKRLDEVRPGDVVYGTIRRGWYRRYVRTRVRAHWRTVKAAYQILLENGVSLTAGPDHRFLTERGWKFVSGADRGANCRPHLTPNNKLMGMGFLTPMQAESPAYRQGYLCGAIRGDGLAGHYQYGGAHQHHFRLAMADHEALDRVRAYLEGIGVSTFRFQFQKAAGNRRALSAIRTNAGRQVREIERIIEWPARASREWARGYLAGIFDAEGSHNDGVLRITNTDPMIIDQIAVSLKRFSFRYVVESRADRAGIRDVRLIGGVAEQLRFLQWTGPAIARKRNIAGLAVKGSARLRVRRVVDLRCAMPLWDITTGTGDFVANGVISHNCYARPYHEYLGFSAGLDFETKILVKTDAAELLRRELAAPSWTPKVLALSGVTDPYQPAERRLGLTRKCLEVLVEFRNPVVVVTKNHLVTRDADLLASHGAAAVFLSVTTLDGGLARKLEPRASAPPRRLAAIETLAKAGVPVGVMIAPVIPGLTEHEIPAILEAAAKAGARHAGFVMLRLPFAVKDVFAKWLEHHAPGRKEKVLGRVREMRGGALNDPRFHRRMRGEGVLADQIRRLFDVSCRRFGFVDGPDLSVAGFRRPDAQLRLF